MTHYIKNVMISKDEIDAFVVRLGQEIEKDYAGLDVVLVGVLKGSFVFMADLVRQINIPLSLDFMSVSSYGGKTKSSGMVKINQDLDVDITGKHVIIVEDIIDSGLTLSHLRELLLTRSPASLEFCTAFDKPSRRKANVVVKYIGMQIPDEFIIGYGLDFDEKYRNLPEVCVLANEGGNE